MAFIGNPVASLGQIGIRAARLRKGSPIKNNHQIVNWAVGGSKLSNDNSAVYFILTALQPGLELWS